MIKKLLYAKINPIIVFNRTSVTFYVVSNWRLKFQISYVSI